MTPKEIRMQLLSAGITQADIVRACDVSPSVVSRVIDGTTISNPVQAVIAEAISKPVDVVFADYHRRKKKSTDVIDRLRAVNDAIRMAS